MAKKPTAESTPNAERKPDRDLGAVPLERIAPGTNVRLVDPATVGELVASIETHGLLHPITVADSAMAGSEGQPPYVLVSGFRRYAAFQKLGRKEIPARWRDMKAPDVLEVQLVENLQREGLSELEEARGFQRYLQEVPGSTGEQLSKRIGKASSYVAGRLRLLKLDPGVQKNLEGGKISASHAEVLASAPAPVQRALSKRTIDKELTVRQLEQETSWRTQRFKDAEREKSAFAEQLAKSKHPICPVIEKGEKTQCGRRATRFDYSGAPWVTDGRMSHVWSLASGSARKERQESHRSPAAPPTPKLPLVAELVPFDASPDELWQHFFGTTRGIRFSRFDVRRQSGKTHVSFSAETSAQLPPGAGDFSIGGHPSKPGHVALSSARDYLQVTDSDRRRIASERDTLVAWGKKIHTSSSSKPKAKSAGKRR